MLPFKLNNIESNYNIEIKGVIHIGANRGEEYQEYNSHKIGSMIFFEPLPDAFHELKIKVGNCAFNYAIGDIEKDVEMYVEEVNQGHSSSVLKPKLHLEKYPWIKFNKRHLVKQITLNSFFKESCLIKDYNMIVVDVQGYELNVFKGATDILNDIDCIISEVNFAELYEGCATIDEIDKFLTEYGFYRAETRQDPNQWGDALYIRRQK